MGTRHLQTVIDKHGNLKLSQYGQWDGYPDGQGIDILNFLRECDMEKYSQEVSKLREITESEAKEVEKIENWPEKYPFLSRDCGADIHSLIQNGQVPYVRMISKEEANKWCEGFYCINLKERTFESNFDEEHSVHSLDNLPSEEDYLKSMTQHEEE